MFGWFKRVRQGMAYARANAAKIEQDEKREATRTKIAGMALVDGLLNRDNVCHRCFSRYVPKEREFAERFQLRAILVVPDHAPDPMFCDYCWDVTVQSYNPKQSNVGTSNHGPSNLALRRLIAKD